MYLRVTSGSAASWLEVEVLDPVHDDEQSYPEIAAALERAGRSYVLHIPREAEARERLAVALTDLANDADSYVEGYAPADADERRVAKSARETFTRLAWKVRRC